MNDKEFLAGRIRDVEKALSKKRRTYNIGIWLGYSAFIGFVMYAIMNASSFLDVLYIIPLALLFGGICWFVNVCVWSPCCWDIFETKAYMEKLIKEFNELE